MSKDKAEKKRLKAEAKLLKARAKAEKKLIEAKAKTKEVKPPASEKPSLALRFAEIVKGLILLIGSASLILAVVLQQKGVWISLDDIVENLMLVRFGQFIVIVIALGLFIYGLKQMRLIK